MLLLTSVEFQLISVNSASQINYIVSDSEFHILNSWRREDQSIHEVIQHPQNFSHIITIET